MEFIQNMRFNFNEIDINRIIEMAWEDRTSLDAIFRQFNLKEADLKRLMAQELKPSSYRLWRERMRKSNLRHEALRPKGVTRAYASNKYKQKN